MAIYWNSYSWLSVQKAKKNQETSNIKTNAALIVGSLLALINQNGKEKWHGVHSISLAKLHTYDKSMQSYPLDFHRLASDWMGPMVMENPLPPFQPLDR